MHARVRRGVADVQEDRRRPAALEERKGLVGDQPGGVIVRRMTVLLERVRAGADPDRRVVVVRRQRAASEPRARRHGDELVPADREGVERPSVEDVQELPDVTRAVPRPLERERDAHLVEVQLGVPMPPAVLAPERAGGAVPVRPHAVRV